LQALFDFVVFPACLVHRVSAGCTHHSLSATPFIPSLYFCIDKLILIRHVSCYLNVDFDIMRLGQPTDDVYININAVFCPRVILSFTSVCLAIRFIVMCYIIIGHRLLHD
jgi:hypothetical protein